MYAAWDMHVSLGEKEYEVDTIKDVDRAWKMKDGEDYIFVRVKVMDTNLAHAKAMIDRVNRHWGWDWVSHNEIAFVLQMKRSDENLVEEYLGHNRYHEENGEGTTMSFPLRPAQHPR
ncbi:hypothetical protein APHAL10511_008484 [Amanita phalloides]|nr:hypothetical protein APHAL10511_008484 [Amanita phalloides]